METSVYDDSLEITLGHVARWHSYPPFPILVVPNDKNTRQLTDVLIERMHYASLAPTSIDYPPCIRLKMFDRTFELEPWYIASLKRVWVPVLEYERHETEGELLYHLEQRGITRHPLFEFQLVCLVVDFVCPDVNVYMNEAEDQIFGNIKQRQSRRNHT